MSNKPSEVCDCPFCGSREVNALRLEAGDRLTLRAEAVVQVKDKALILAFMAAHEERYAHAPLVTLFLARDWFTTRGCQAVVRPVEGVNPFTAACTRVHLALTGFLWKRLGMAMYRGQSTCEGCAARLREKSRQMATSGEEGEGTHGE